MGVEIFFGQTGVDSHVKVAIALDQLTVPIKDFGIDRQSVLMIHVDESGHAVIPSGRVGGEVQDISPRRTTEGATLAVIFDRQFAVLQATRGIISDEIEEFPDTHIGDRMTTALPRTG